MREERRRSMRFQVYVAGTVTADASGDTGVGHMLDMSRHGMLLSTGIPLEIDDTIAFSAALTDVLTDTPDLVFDVAARVVADHHEESMGVTVTHLRCEFTDASREKNADLINALIAAHGGDPLRPTMPPPPTSAPGA